MGVMKFRILEWGGCFGRCGVALTVISGVLIRGRQRGLGRYRREKGVTIFFLRAQVLLKPALKVLKLILRSTYFTMKQRMTISNVHF